MASVIPSDNAALLAWGNLHAGIFVDHAVALGLTVPQGTEFKDANIAMQEAWDAVNAAKAALKTAQNTWTEKKKSFRTIAAQDVGLIKNFASRQPDPAVVYNLAQIPAPATPTYNIPPNAPIEVRAVLDTETGALTVRWSATQPSGMSGVVYNVQRVLGSGTNFATAGLTGVKSFIDVSIPAGTSRIQYRVIAQRGNLVSPASMTLDVRLATDPAGMMTMTSMTTKESVKLAA